MPTSSEQSTRKLAAVLFSDIQGYTALMQKDDKKAYAQLQRYQSVLKKHVDEQDGEIVKSYGDGSICLFSSTSSALECAFQVQKELRTDLAVPLRIGLHSGDVIRTGDDVYGDAVNISSRIESMGVAGNILLSRSFYERVKNQSQFKFQSLGMFDFKNVSHGMEVFAIANEGFVVPKRSELKGKFKEKKRLGKLKWALPVLILFAAISIWQLRGVEKEIIDPFDYSKSILVLPLKDLSPGIDQKYFSYGMTLDIINLLSRVPQLKVIGNRTSQAYESSVLTKQQIAEELNVDYILEGVILQNEDRLKIDIQLLDGESGESIWPYQIDDQIQNIFNAQEDLVKKISYELQFSISEDALQQYTTDNIQAYLLLKEAVYAFTKSFAMEWEKAEKLCIKSHELDSTFMPSLSMLANITDYKRQMDTLTLEDAKVELKYYIDKMIALDSNTYFVHLNLAIYYGNYDLDYNKAYYHLNQALTDNSLGSEDISNAALHLRHYDIERSKYYGNIALELDPANPWVYHHLGWIYCNSLEFDKSVEMFEQFERLTSNKGRVSFFETFFSVLEGNFELGIEKWGQSEQNSALFQILIFSRDGEIEKFDEAVKQYVVQYPEDYTGIAWIYTYQEYNDQAFEWLERGYAAKVPGIVNSLSTNLSIKYNPHFVKLHEDPRWDAFLKKLGFPETVKG